MMDKSYDDNYVAGNPTHHQHDKEEAQEAKKYCIQQTPFDSRSVAGVISSQATRTIGPSDNYMEGFSWPSTIGKYPSNCYSYYLNCLLR
jgi:hypothetical protein